MKINVEEYRKSALYTRSLDLNHEVNRFLKENQQMLDKTVVSKFLEYGISIPKKIALAMGQTNTNIRCKKLNEAKKSLLQLNLLLKEASRMPGSVRVEDYSVQVLKLFNYYFGQLKKKKLKQ